MAVVLVVVVRVAVRVAAAVMRAKMKNRPNRKAENRGPSLGPKPQDFGDQVTADHIIQEGLEDIGMNEEPCALIMKDRGNDYIDAFSTTRQIG